MIRVAVLGSTGMLGHIVVRELTKDPRFHVKSFCRNPSNDEGQIDVHVAPTLEFIEDVDYVVNCIGLIKQLTVSDRHDWYVINSIFPWMLAERCRTIGAKLIQISTDCVYTGNRGRYTEYDVHDASDDYGLSKSLGEPDRAMVLRTSVIGEELKGKLSLLEWAIAHRGQYIEGYENHFWNGLTSVEYARVCGRIMSNQMFEAGVFHIYSDAVSKHKLLTLINHTYDLNLDIVPVKVYKACDRTLCSVKSLNKKLDIPTLSKMIDSLFAQSRYKL